MTSHVAALIGRDCLLSALSPADYKVLRLLQKGYAYQVRGAWRFRGSRARVKERALVSVLEQGLAERIETGQHRLGGGRATSPKTYRSLGLSLRSPW